MILLCKLNKKRNNKVRRSTYTKIKTQLYGNIKKRFLYFRPSLSNFLLTSGEIWKDSEKLLIRSTFLLHLMP